MTGKQNRIHPGLILAALAGLILTFLTAEHFIPFNSFPNSITRSDAISISRDYLKKKGYPVDQYESTAWVTDTDNHRLAWKYTSYDRANELADSATHGLFSARWQTYFYQNVNQSAPQRKFYLFLDGTGRVTGFSFVLYEKIENAEFGNPNLEQIEARKIFDQFLSADGLDTTGFATIEASSVHQEKRTQHTFKLQKPFPELESKLQIYGMVSGSELTVVVYELIPPEKFSSEKADFQGIGFLIFLGSVVIFFFVLILQLGVFLKKYHEGEVGVKTAGTLFWIMLIVSSFVSLSKFPVAGYGFGFGELSYTWVSIVTLVIKLLIFNPLYALAVFSAWSIGESYLRESHSDKLASLDGLINKQWANLHFAVSVACGYLTGFIGLGLLFLSGWITIKFTGGTNNLTFYQDVLPVYAPFATPFIVGIYYSLLGELMFRLFGNLYLTRLLKNKWIAGLISALLWAAFSQVFWGMNFFIEPLWISFAIPFLIGFYLNLVFWKTDILSTVIASFTISGGISMIPLLASSGPVYTLYSILALLLMAIPAFLMIAGFITKKKFTYNPDTTPAHIRRITERVRMVKELEIARQVQMKLLPKRSPDIKGFDIAGICIPALEVGGDYYDFIDIPNGNIGIAVGDVSGKGLPAAIYMTLTKGIVQSHADEFISPSVVLSKVNQLLYKSIEKGNFVSMFYAILNLETRKMVLSRAGHNPAVYLFKDEQVKNLKPSGLALGLEKGELFDKVIRDEEVQLVSGDVVVFYTDGYTEAMNEKKDEFGEDRLISILKSTRLETAEKMISAINKEIKGFAGSAHQHDDMTMVVIKVL